MGWVKHEFSDVLKRWPDTYIVTDNAVNLAPSLTTFAARTQNVERSIRAMIAEQLIHRWHGEPFPVITDYHAKPLLLIDRASAANFGIRAFGQHLNGYVKKHNGLYMWVARRAKTKTSFPNKLDNMVAGGLPYGISLQGNLEKECWEEATLPPDLAKQAIAVGAITYTKETSSGLKPDILFNYDLELPQDFVPRCNDDEVEEFMLMPIEQVAEIADNTDQVKLNSNLVIIDFLVRHGYLGADHPDYLAIINGLHGC